MRELEAQLGGVNSYGYKATRVATFKQFVALWRKDILPMHRPSTQNTVGSVLEN